MLDIKDYLLEYKRKVPNILLLWSFILVFIITVILIINSTFKIIDYYQIKGIVKEGNLNILVPLEEVSNVVDNNYIYIDEERYKYNVKEISNSIVEEGNIYYQNIILDVELKGKIFIDNNIVEVKFVIKKMTILKYICNLIKGEF